MDIPQEKYSSYFGFYCVLEKILVLVLRRFLKVVR